MAGYELFINPEGGFQLIEKTLNVFKIRMFNRFNSVHFFKNQDSDKTKCLITGPFAIYGRGLINKVFAAFKKRIP